RENEGNTAVEFAVMTPLLLFVAIGAFYVLSLISVYNTLYSATYRAARLLSVEGPYLSGWGRGGEAQQAAQRFVADQLQSQQAQNVWTTSCRGRCSLNVVLSSDNGPNQKPDKCAGTSEGQPFNIQDVAFGVETRLDLDPSQIVVIKEFWPKNTPLTLM